MYDINMYYYYYYISYRDREEELCLGKLTIDMRLQEFMFMNKNPSHVSLSRFTEALCTVWQHRKTIFTRECFRSGRTIVFNHAALCLLLAALISLMRLPTGPDDSLWVTEGW